MTILTSVATRDLVSSFNALPIRLVTLCSEKYLVLVLGHPSSWSVRFLPQATLQPEGTSPYRIPYFFNAVISNL